MHLFNAGRLANELRANALSETEKFRYFLVLLVLRTTNEALRASTPQPRNHLLDLVLFSAISLLGYYICHVINRSGDDQRLIERLICLSVPVSIWIFLLSTGSYFVGFIAVQTVLGRTEALALWAFFNSNSSIMTSAFLAIHMGALIYFIAQIARPQAATSQAPLAAP